MKYDDDVFETPEYEPVRPDWQGEASIAIAWDPSVVTAEEYATLIAAIGDLARFEGAVGIQRILSATVGAPSSAGALT